MLSKISSFQDQSHSVSQQKTLLEKSTAVAVKETSTHSCEEKQQYSFLERVNKIWQSFCRWIQSIFCCVKKDKAIAKIETAPLPQKEEKAKPAISQEVPLIEVSPSVQAQKTLKKEQLPLKKRVLASLDLEPPRPLKYYSRKLAVEQQPTRYSVTQDSAPVSSSEKPQANAMEQASKVMLATLYSPFAVLVPRDPEVNDSSNTQSQAQASSFSNATEPALDSSSRPLDSLSRMLEESADVTPPNSLTVHSIPENLSGPIESIKSDLLSAIPKPSAVPQGNAPQIPAFDSQPEKFSSQPAPTVRDPIPSSSSSAASQEPLPHSKVDTQAEKPSSQPVPVASDPIPSSSSSAKPKEPEPDSKSANKPSNASSPPTVRRTKSHTRSTAFTGDPVQRFDFASLREMFNKPGSAPVTPEVPFKTKESNRQEPGVKSSAKRVVFDLSDSQPSSSDSPKPPNLPRKSSLKPVQEVPAKEEQLPVPQEQNSGSSSPWSSSPVNNPAAHSSMDEKPSSIPPEKLRRLSSLTPKPKKDEAQASPANLQDPSAQGQKTSFGSLADLLSKQGKSSVGDPSISKPESSEVNKRSLIRQESKGDLKQLSSDVQSPLVEQHSSDDTQPSVRDLIERNKHLFASLNGPVVCTQFTPNPVTAICNSIGATVTQLLDPPATTKEKAVLGNEPEVLPPPKWNPNLVNLKYSRNNPEVTLHHDGSISFVFPTSQKEYAKRLSEVLKQCDIDSQYEEIVEQREPHRGSRFSQKTLITKGVMVIHSPRDYLRFLKEICKFGEKDLTVLCEGFWRKLRYVKNADQNKALELVEEFLELYPYNEMFTVIRDM